MAPLQKSNAWYLRPDASDTYTHQAHAQHVDPVSHTPTATMPFTAWTDRQAQESTTRMRTTVILAANRLKISSRRCDELRDQADDVYHQLLNAHWSMSEQRRSELERRIVQYEAALHTERLTVWRDLLPLVRDMRDASIDDLRRSFLSEFQRLTGIDQASDERPRQVLQSGSGQRP